MSAVLRSAPDLLPSDDEADGPEPLLPAAGGSTDPVKDYLRLIARVRLLTAEQEVDIARRIEAGIVSLRYGLTDGRPRTLEEIGHVYGVTRERTRQIEAKTMTKLRHPSRSQVLLDYLDGS